MIPFVELRNNDLWNLLPAKGEINIRKSHRIPTGELLRKPGVKNRVIQYWENLLYDFPEQFRSEIQVSLLGHTRFTERTWKNESYDRLMAVCHHMIEDRGFEPWLNI